MDVLTEVFSRLCGRGRCFVIDGAALPVCQRCLGLYAGAAITGIWLFVSGLWRRGLPSRGAFVLHVGMLVAGILGGIHVIDAGPRWRLMCGLWTGHVVVVWLVGAAVHLRIANKLVCGELPPSRAREEAVVRQQSRPLPHGRGSDDGSPSHAPSRTGSDHLPGAVAMAAVLSVLALAFPHLEWLGWYTWTGVIVAGAVVLVLAVLGACVAVAVWFIGGVRTLTRIRHPAPHG